ncbi:hypothetical protein GV828_12265 [Flavobacterium sp. NST-5]|uniref:Uncharacterized protein n=1 Tax=Flavobacterium ichthyis TaxID=2698827 RepID=A0ABW9ZE02_9FLAO|nr:type IIL restriction-modification enzyme MmeI [Flavobacterium ichthyis]NBL65974.1 hypothetical protein [Flavobacterium ichthyis]
MEIGKPMPLLSNKGKSFQGSIVLGKGFILTTEEAENLIKNDPRNKDVIFPYLNGDDLNNDSEQKPSRWVINFFDWDEEKARTYPDCYQIIEKLVKPERQRWKIDNEGNEIVGTYALRKPLPQKWWIYGEKRPALYNAISELDQVMVLNRHAKHLLISICKNNIVFSEATVVFALNSFSNFSILSSSIHDVWAWKNSSTMGTSTLRYSGTNAFETFPFSSISSDLLNSLGSKLHQIRLKIMKENKIGLTELQNKFHDININNEAEIYYHIKELRELYRAIDNEIIKLYKWTDIDLKHDFYELDHLPENDRLRFTIYPKARKEILKRLLIINLRQYAEESKTNVIHTKNNKKLQKVSKIKTSSSILFPED